MIATTATGYLTQFQQYLARHVAYVLTLVQQARPVLSDELRVQALHTLSYALHASAEWAVTRDLITNLLIGSLGHS